MDIISKLTYFIENGYIKHIDDILLSFTGKSESEGLISRYLNTLISNKKLKLEPIVLEKELFESIVNRYQKLQTVTSENSYRLNIEDIVGQYVHIIDNDFFVTNSENYELVPTEKLKYYLMGRIDQEVSTQKKHSSIEENLTHEFEGLIFKVPRSGFWSKGEIKVNEPNTLITPDIFLQYNSIANLENARFMGSKYVIHLYHFSVDGHGRSDHSESQIIFLESLEDVNFVSEQLAKKIANKNKNSNEQFSYRVNELSL